MAVIANALDVALPESEGVMRFVARQPILDLHCVVHGYELLFRGGLESVFSGDGDFATRTMLDNTVIFWAGKAHGGVAGVCELHLGFTFRAAGRSSSAWVDHPGDT
jgi:hypothetical protein